MGATRCFSVLLLLVTPSAGNYSIDTYMAWVEAPDHAKAIAKARREAFNRLDNSDRTGRSPKEYKVLGWFAGHIPVGVCWNSDHEYLILNPPGR